MNHAMFDTMLPPETFRSWYSEHQADLSWLEKPSRHQFRWRLVNDRWVTATRQFSTAGSLQTMLTKHGPRDVYIGTSAWLSPLNLPKISDEQAPHPVLIDHLVVFDVDFQPFCYRRLEEARKATHQLLTWIENNESLTLLCISYSGGKGFHLILKDNDRSLFAIPDPKQREEAVRTARSDLLQRVLAQGFPVDTTVTADTRRIIRLPGSLHGTTGWACTRITREQLATPLKSWVKALPKHPHARRMPRSAFEWRSLLPRRSSSPRNAGKTQATTHPNNLITVMQCSTQVVGTNGRSAFMAWIPTRWDEGHIDAVAQRLRGLGWGPVHRFEHREQTLLIGTRAVPKEQLAKETAAMGWVNMSNTIKHYGHAWVDLTPVMTEEEHQEGFRHLGLWEVAGQGDSRTPFSATHLEVLRRLGVEIDPGDADLAGRAEPAMRIVSKK